MNNGTKGASGTNGGIRTRLWRNGRLEVEDFPIEDISDHLAEEDALVWLDLCEPDHTVLLKLADELSFDPHAVEDAIASAERPKATRHATHTFVTVYAARIRIDGNPQPTAKRPVGANPQVSANPQVGAKAQAAAKTQAAARTQAGAKAQAVAKTHARSKPELGPLESRLQLSRVSAFVLPNAIVTVRGDSHFDMDQVVARWEDDAELLKLGVGALLHGLLDVIVDGHFETVQLMDDAIESLEDGLFDDQSITREIQQRTYRVRKELVELRRVILPMREVVNSVQRQRIEGTGHRTELDGWYADLYDHVLRVSEWTESLRDMVTTVFETNLSLQDARLNTVMKKLTGWAAIIAVPTAVTGWFGQNVAYPGFGHTSGLIESTVVITVMAGALYISFRRRGWL